VKLDEILIMDDLSRFTPAEVCNILAIIFETGREQGDPVIIKKGIAFAEKQLLTLFNKSERATFYFNTANAWGYLRNMTSSAGTNSWEFHTTETEQEIVQLRLSLAICSEIDDRDLHAQVLTNLGNAFSHVGRFVEAVSYWHRAITVKPGFGMAIGNLGYGLGHYARVLFDDGHQFKFCQYAYKLLLDGIESKDVYVEAKGGFAQLAQIIEKRYGKDNLMSAQKIGNHTLGETELEQVYRKWCLENALFLNPLNDFIMENYVAHDCLVLPTITVPAYTPPLYHTMYNQVKQEFASARYLCYEGMNSSSVHFSDEDNLLMDTLDYAVYSLSSEKLKMAYRLCYSIFDKVAYLLNAYLKLGLQSGEVSFKRVWYKKGSDNKRPLFNPIVTQSQNWPLRGLFWLSKDLSEAQNSFSEALLQDAKQLAAIRNFIEHKSFKIIEYGTTGVSGDGLTFVITRNELVEKTVLLLQTARSAIMYIIFAINVEEQKSKHTGPALSIPFKELDNRYKR